MLNYIKMIEVGPVPNVKRGRTILNRAKRAGYLAMGRHWFIVIRPQHFSNRASSKYGYDPRSGDPGKPGRRGFQKSYQGRKLAEHGHTRPLERTGASRSATGTGTLTSSSRHVRISMPAGWIGSSAHRRHGIDLADELTRVDQADAEELGKVFITEARKKYLAAVSQAVEVM
jgi:hypothetical protein